MLLKFIAVSSLFLIAVFNLPAAQPTIDSIYTDLSANKCKTIETDEESGSSVQICAGIEGYNLQVEDSDARMTITVVGPDGKKHPLELWSVISQSFSTLGEKAEWRVKKENGKNIPIALIVRYNASEDPEDFKKVTSYLAVAKITSEKICVTDKINPVANANEEARRAADMAAGKACIK